MQLVLRRNVSSVLFHKCLLLATKSFANSNLIFRCDIYKCCNVIFTKYCNLNIIFLNITNVFFMLIKNVPFRHCIINNSECYYKCKLVNNCNVHGDMCRFTFKLIYLLNMCSPLTILTCILIIEECKYIIVTNICVYCTRYIEHVVLNTTFLYLLI